jgi:hypothetical protein
MASVYMQTESSLNVLLEDISFNLFLSNGA